MTPRRRHGRGAALLVGTGLLLSWAACAPRTAPRPVATPLLPAEIRVAIASGVPTATLSGDDGLVATGSALRQPLRIGGNTGMTLTQGGGGIALGDGTAPVRAEWWEVRPATRNGTIHFGGREYPGVVVVTSAASGLVVVDRVPLEDYVASVVTAEMGHRAANELAALEAQAIVSRTYAVRHRELSGARPYDLVAARDDQVFTGAGAVDRLALRATRATAGEVLTWHGMPIDAFFFSTCGGRTEDGSAVFAGADRPYLRSVSDLDPHGRAWCAISPRYSWTEEWSGDALRQVLAATLPANSYPADRAEDLTDVAVTATTGSGRAAAVTLQGANGATTITGQAIRRVLAPVHGGLLWSTRFAIRVSRRGEEIASVEISGHGSGHGVGMCQWGAIGRARAGQDYRTILGSYFPGTTMQRIH